MPRTIQTVGKRVPLNMRTTAVCRDMLEAAASASGRSLAQEVEYRLQMSFDQEAIADALALRVLKAMVRAAADV
jgi:hypothetical protein